VATTLDDLASEDAMESNDEDVVSMWVWQGCGWPGAWVAQGLTNSEITPGFIEWKSGFIH
jgi:hypothetical protein